MGESPFSSCYKQCHLKEARAAWDQVMRAGATTTRSKSNTVPWKRSSSSLHACANVRELLTEGMGVRWGSDVQFRLCSERHAKWAQGLEVAMHATLPAGGAVGGIGIRGPGWPAWQWRAVRHPDVGEVPVDLCLVFRVGGHGRSQELHQRHRQTRSCMQAAARRGFLDHPRNDTLSFCRCPAVLINHHPTTRQKRPRWRLHFHVHGRMVS
jgi:hypothetical protein